MTDVEVEVRTLEELSSSVQLACLPRDPSAPPAGDDAEAVRLAVSTEPTQEGTRAVTRSTGDSTGPVRLRPTGLQRYVVDLQLGDPGRYELGVRVSYDTSGGATETVESEALRLVRLPIPAGQGVSLVPADDRPVCRSSNFPAEGPPRLLADVEVAAGAVGDVVRFEYDDGAPSIQVERIEPPITARPSGRPIEVAGTSYLAVRMAPASRVDLSGDEPRQTYEGPERLSPTTDLITELVLTEDAPGQMTWVIGLSQPSEFTFGVDGQTVAVSVRPRE